MKPEATARLLHAFTAAAMRLPWAWWRAVAHAMAAYWRRSDARESRVARRNLELACPDMPPAEREALHREILRTTARQVFETLRFWTRPHAQNLARIREQQGVELFDQARAQGRSVIIAAPHYGNWELLNQWLASRGPFAFVYRVPESPVGDAFLQRARGASNITQVRAEGAAVRQLWKQLKDGGVVAILPDQQPKAGDGEFAPFFGVQALTMTLLSRLAERTGAQVLFAYCERIGDGLDFSLHFEAAPPAIGDADPLIAVTALNAGVERIARRHMAQYQWTYKRYTLRPPGSGEDNPYH